MIAIFLATINVGVAYGVFNLRLIQYLSGQFGSRSTPSGLIFLGLFLTVFLNPLFGFLSDKLKSECLLYL